MMLSSITVLTDKLILPVGSFDVGAPRTCHLPDLILEKGASCCSFFVRSLGSLFLPLRHHHQTSTHLLFLTVLSQKDLNLLLLFEQKDRFAGFPRKKTTHSTDTTTTNNSVECIEYSSTFNIPRTQYSTHLLGNKTKSIIS